MKDTQKMLLDIEVAQDITEELLRRKKLKEETEMEKKIEPLLDDTEVISSEMPVEFEQIDAPIQDAATHFTDFENDTEYFNPSEEEALDLSNALVYKTAVDPQSTVSFFKDKGKEERDESSHSKKEDSSERMLEKSAKTIRKYYRLLVASFFVCLLFILCLLIIKINSDNQKLANINPNLPTKVVGADDNIIQELEAENERLSAEVEQLRNSIQQMMLESGADTTIQPPVVAVAEPVATTQLEPVQAVSVSNDQPVTEIKPTQTPKNNGIYIVQSGDTLMKIAVDQYGKAGDYLKIVEANKIKGYEIYPGQKLIIP